MGVCGKAIIKAAIETARDVNTAFSGEAVRARCRARSAVGAAAGCDVAARGAPAAGKDRAILRWGLIALRVGSDVARSTSSENAMLANSKPKLRRDRFIITSPCSLLRVIGVRKLEALGKRCLVWRDNLCRSFRRQAIAVYGSTGLNAIMALVNFR